MVRRLYALILMSTIGVAQCNQDRFVVITFLYNERNAQRVAEYKECIERNLQHPSIEKVHVIYDVTNDAVALAATQHGKKKRQGDETPNLALLDYIRQKGLSITNYAKGRPTFRYCIELANRLYPNKKIILMNADIYFDETLDKVFGVSLENRMLVFTRWDLKKNRVPVLLHLHDGTPNDMSSDVWIFKTPMRDIPCGDLQIGTVHCEGQFALAAHNAGLSLYNPCRSVKCYHLHVSGVRHWSLIPEPENRKAVQWCTIEDIPR